LIGGSNDNGCVGAAWVFVNASIRWFINGKLAAAKHEPVITFGTITLENKTLGNLTCQSVVAGNAWNETTEGFERGFENTTGYTTFECEATAAPCKVKNTKGEEVEGIFATAEAPPIAEGTEAHLTGVSSLPWTGELTEREAGRRQILTHNVKVWIVLPSPTIGKGPGCRGTEIPFEDQEGPSEKAEGDELAPVWVNGSRNGLKPSHGEFLGEIGLTEKGFPITGRLISSAIGPGYIKAKQVIAGAKGGWELITAE
jgi:hypothetical protein